MENSYEVFIQINERNCVTNINSSIVVKDTSNWIKIDGGIGARFAYAQSKYLGKPLTDENGVFNYKCVDGVLSERTAEEIQADIPTVETPITWEDYALDFEFRLSIVEMTGGETI